MIWHPASLALLAGSAAALALALLAVVPAARILRRWDLSSSSESQFALERSTALLSTLAAWAVGVSAASIFLFIAAADDFSRTLAGAMCATGALNANPVGWVVLAVKGATLLFGAVWLALNSVDNACHDYPLVRLKYGALLALVPLFALDFVLLWSFLAGLRPDVITSCCGSLFSTVNGRPQSVLAALPPLPMMRAFDAATAGLWTIGLLCAVQGGRLLHGLYALGAAAYFAFALAAVVSFVAPYVYGLPFHHCPFDMFQAAYGFLGYPLFVSLAIAGIFGALPGVLLPFAGGPCLREVLPCRLRRWVRLSLSALLVFNAIVYWKVRFAGLKLY